jgi:phage anti-repressor protein
LNYTQKTDFVIDVDNIWKWLGFNQKYNAYYLLEKYFTENIDYIILPILKEDQKKGSGGHNKKKILSHFV